jgi:hypothetical protein
MVIAFLTASGLIALLATKDPSGEPTISHQAIGMVGGLSVFIGLGLALVMSRIAKRFVSFSRKRPDPWP